MNISNSEKGIALVLALVMLALLSILGAYALSTSSTEMFIAGNYRNTELAFSTADAGAEFGVNQLRANGNALVPLTNVWPVAGTGDSTHDPAHNFNERLIGTNTADISITRIPEVNTRATVGLKRIKDSSGYVKSTGESSNELSNSADLSGAAYYIVHSIGYGPNNSRAEVEFMVWLPAPGAN